MHGRDPEHLLRETTWLRRLAQQLVADGATADDLAADALAALAAQRQPVRSLRGWLATVLRHRAGRQHRRAVLRQRGERAAARPEAVEAVDDAIARAELHRAVVDAVLALREPQRSAVVLRHLDDLPLAEVAARLRVPVETARTRIKRGLGELRQRLDQRFGGRAAWAALLLPQPVPLPPPTLPFWSLLMGTKSLLAAAAVTAAAVVYLLLPQAPAPEDALPAAGAPPAAAAATSSDEPQVAARQQLPAPPPAETGAAAAPPTAVVSGRAVDEASGQPLGGVRVGFLANDGDGAPEQAQTGADGRFELATAAPRPGDRLSLLLRHDERALVTKMLGSPRGEAPLQFDVGDVSMPPGTAVTGVVLDHRGVAAGDVPLFVCLHSFWTSNGRLVRLEQAQPIGRSGRDGRFRLDARLLPNRPPPLLLAAGAAGVGWIDLDQLHRERSEQQVELHLLPPCELQVHVVDERGAAVAGARLVAEPRLPPFAMPAGYPIAIEAVPQLCLAFGAATAADGSAVLRPLAVPAAGAAYTLRAEADGRDRAVVELQLPHAGVVEVVLPAARPLLVRGSVRDAGGRPIRGASVSAHWREVAVAPTGDDGTFALQVARGDGPLWLSVRADGCFPERRQLQPDAAAAGVETDFTLRAAATLRGQVLDQAGRPVAGAEAYAGGRGQGVPTGKDGSFVLLVEPAAATLLHVAPPQPQSFWAGGIDHLVEPGQRSVQLQLQRLPPGRGTLAVELLDAQGGPLDAERVALVRRGGVDGLWHPATAELGRITAADLAPGDWSLTVETRSGCGLAAAFAVPAGGDAVRLRLQQALAASAEGRVDGGDAAQPVEVAFAGQAARFAAAPGQQLLDAGRRLRLPPGASRTVGVVDVDPARPLQLVASCGGARGEAQLQVAAGGRASFAIVLQPLATLRLQSSEPFAADRLLLQLRRPGGDWGEPLRVEGLAGRRELLALPVAAGAWEWRLRLPTRGADNRGGGWHAGSCTVAAGASAVVPVPAP